MKDFKKMPKMACGGVAKYEGGGSIVAEARKAIRSGKDVDSGMLKTPKQSVTTFPGEGQIDYNAVEMPSRSGGAKRTVNLPGFGEVDRDKVQARKTGGKVKRGNKK
jgi:hypothetical protein